MLSNSFSLRWWSCYQTLYHPSFEVTAVHDEPWFLLRLLCTAPDPGTFFLSLWPSLASSLFNWIQPSDSRSAYPPSASGLYTVNVLQGSRACCGHLNRLTPIIFDIWFIALGIKFMVTPWSSYTLFLNSTMNYSYSSLLHRETWSSGGSMLLPVTTVTALCMLFELSKSTNMEKELEDMFKAR